ncbi:MAG: hypothetical protein HQK96_20290 [Nitrospirae bacterium]|nr:hypothetical protein [Nitrospirota bacterium]
MNGYDNPLIVRTLSGRIRKYDTKPSANQAANTIIQGTGADILKKALTLMRERLQQSTSAFINLTVHDEILVETPIQEIDNVIYIVRYSMIEAFNSIITNVPAVIDIKVLNSWDENDVYIK